MKSEWNQNEIRMESILIRKAKIGITRLAYQSSALLRHSSLPCMSCHKFDFVVIFTLNFLVIVFVLFIVISACIQWNDFAKRFFSTHPTSLRRLCPRLGIPE